jgi:hypothetical protein
MLSGTSLTACAGRSGSQSQWLAGARRDQTAIVAARPVPGMQRTRAMIKGVHAVEFAPGGKRLSPSVAALPGRPAVLDRLSADGVGRARLRAGGVVPGPDGLTRGEVTIELVFDPPGHVRLPGNEDEIIDRAFAVEPLADRKVTLLTYDTSQSTRARNAGLRIVKLSQDVGESRSK